MFISNSTKIQLDRIDLFILTRGHTSQYLHKSHMGSFEPQAKETDAIHSFFFSFLAKI